MKKKEGLAKLKEEISHKRREKQVLESGINTEPLSSSVPPPLDLEKIKKMMALDTEIEELKDKVRRLGG